MHLAKKLLLMLLLGASLVGSGCCAICLLCFGAAAGAGTAVYVRGELRSTEIAPYKDVVDAMRTTLAEKHYTITEDTTGPQRTELTARGPGDTKAAITMEWLSDTTTDVRIRVDIWGNEDKSRELLTAMRAKLPSKR